MATMWRKRSVGQMLGLLCTRMTRHRKRIGKAQENLIRTKMGGRNVEMNDPDRCSARYARTLGNRPKSAVSTLCSSAFPRHWCARPKTDLVKFDHCCSYASAVIKPQAWGSPPSVLNFSFLVLLHAADDAIHVLRRSYVKFHFQFVFLSLFVL